MCICHSHLMGCHSWNFLHAVQSGTMLAQECISVGFVRQFRSKCNQQCVIDHCSSCPWFRMNYYFKSTSINSNPFEVICCYSEPQSIAMTTLSLLSSIDLVTVIMSKKKQLWRRNFIFIYLCYFGYILIKILCNCY